MHIVFLNPQGNFDAKDSYLTEHPDFGGQLVYVKEVAQALVDLGHKVDIVTRRIRDAAWPEFAEDQSSYPDYEENLRILRFPCGGDRFLEKEQLWPHLPAFIASMLEFYGDALPDFATGIKMAKVNDLSLTGGTGTSCTYKISFANQSEGSKVANIKGVSLQY